MSPALLGLLLVCLAPPSDEEAIVARAGSVVLTREAFADWLVERVGYLHAGECLNELLILAAAEEAGCSPTDEQVAEAAGAQRAEVIRVQFRGDEQAYLADLARKGFDPERHEERQRADVRIYLCLAGLAAELRTIDEPALRKRFADLYGDVGERVSLEVLFFSAYHGLRPEDDKPPLAELKARATERARAAAAALADGRPLAELQPGSDPIASDFVHDGRIDLYRKRMLGLEVERAVASLDDPGDTSPVIPIWDGAYVLRLVGREAVSFEQARPELERLLREAPPSSEELSAARAQVLQASDAEVLLR